MTIKIIKTKKAYEEALARINKLWEAKAGTKEFDELELLSLLVEHYEAVHYSILAPDPVAAIKFRLEQLGLDQKDVAKLIGDNRASEVLNYKRPLSLKMIKVLYSELKIPVESLIGV